jgi:hypothetical protein
MIAQAETQSVLFKHENESIKTTLLRSNIPIPAIAPTAKSVSGQNTDSTTPASTLQEQPPHNDFSISGSPQNSQWASNTSSSGSLVSMTFDEMINASCLQITPLNSLVPENDILMNSPDIFNFPTDSFVPVAASHPTPIPNFPGLNQELSKALPKLPEEAAAPVSPATLKDFSTIAINFILASVTLPFCPLYLSSTSKQLIITIDSNTPAVRISTPTLQRSTPKALLQATN